MWNLKKNEKRLRNRLSLNKTKWQLDLSNSNTNILNKQVISETEDNYTDH